MPLLATMTTAGLAFTAFPAPAQAHLSTFRIGIQLADGKSKTEVGIPRFTNYTSVGGGASAWAGDANRFDPDAVRINLDAARADSLRGLDFRIGGRARDNNGHEGPWRYTTWASEGSSDSSLVTDDNGFDPDEYRLVLQTRPWPSSATPLRDFRFSIKAVDKGRYGHPMSTPWASQHQINGWSGWAMDDNGVDFDGITIKLEVRR